MTREEYDRTMQRVEALIDKDAETRTPQEDALLDRLVGLAHAYEVRHFPIGKKPRHYRRNVDRQEALVKELHAMLRRNQPTPDPRGGEAGVVWSVTPHEYVWRQDAVRIALDRIMEIFGYEVTPIQ